MERLTGWFPIILLALLAGLTMWLDRQVQANEHTRDGTQRHDPDYIVENFTATRTGADGRPYYKLNAQRMVHYPDDDSTFLEAPRLVQYRPSGVVITATAKGALLSSNGEQIDLMDDVRLTRSPYENKSELTVVTPYLQVIPNENLAKTNRPVTIYDANSLTTAIGLEFNTQTENLKFISNVRSAYTIPKRGR
jgi:lipopolysaccharide export system protein LptC